MSDSSEQMASAAYRLPALDADFLLGDSTRGIRFQLEYQKATEALRAAGIRSTIVVFGSARIVEDGPENHRRWYAEARRFGMIASQKGGALNADEKGRLNVIATGGGPGVMEAANRGAREAGAPTIGFNITLPKEQRPNPYTTPDLTFRFHYFAMRKMHLAMHAAALVVFPGGFGTLDELFEILTLRQTGKMGRCPVVLIDREFWSRLIDLDLLLTEGFIHQGDRSLFHMADSAEEAWAWLEREGLRPPRR